MSYKPEPIDTSEVKLSDEILDLTELLAKNAHDIWAQQRISDDWIWGAKRDDARKEHPNLVPYEELTEPEKDYDRKMVLLTLKAILALGYHIQKP